MKYIATSSGNGSPLAVPAAVGAVGLLAWLDYSTGIEIRIYPLYFLPICLASWVLPMGGALAFALLCSGVWTGANLMIEGIGWGAEVWAINSLAQMIAFSTVALLVARLRRESLRVEALSLTDALTGIPNARAFHQLARNELAVLGRLGKPVTLAYMDLDKFKLVNDRLGHKEGDSVLREFAAVLRERLRSSDLYARLGGDEFAVLIPDSLEHARPLLEEIRTLAAARLERGDIQVTVSVGAATRDQAPGELDELLREADALMYEVKRARHSERREAPRE